MPNSTSIEIRDPIHGFIELSSWEKDVINHPAFQRLRRIRQLELSELIYPGTTHTRFEHSLGVMHIGTKMFDRLKNKCSDFLTSKLNFNQPGLERDRTIVRFACLLHDIGHSPFSHAGEDIMPTKEDGSSYKHEDYSAAIIKLILKDVVEKHDDNQNVGISAEDIADMIEGRPSSLRRRYIWHNIVSSQLDADRSDYLLRDSYYAGVTYGHFDLDRILDTLTIAYNSEKNPVFAIEEGGKHVAESLIIARYMMFWQVYFQKTRRICDYHATEAVKEVLTNYFGCPELPPPTTKENLEKYLELDDYSIFGEMKKGKCGRHSDCLFNRKHDRCVFQSQMLHGNIDEEANEENRYERAKEVLGNLITFEDDASASWYKSNEDIPIYNKQKDVVEDLSSISQIIPALEKSGRKRIYVRAENTEQAKTLLGGIL